MNVKEGWDNRILGRLGVRTRYPCFETGSAEFKGECLVRFAVVVRNPSGLTIGNLLPTVILYLRGQCGWW